MRVTVIGATGFIGAWAVRALAARGCDVTAIVRPTSDPWRLGGVPVRIVAATGAATPGAVLQSKPEVVIDISWSGVAALDRDNRDLQESNVGRQRLVIAAAVDAGARRVVATGSQAEYGAVSGPTGEDTELHPDTAYGRAKIAASENLRTVADGAGIEWAWARIFSVYGPLESGDFVMPRIARAAVAGSSYALSSGDQPWSYLYAPDAGRAIADLALLPGVHGIYNVGHPDAPPLRQSLERFAHALGSPSAVSFGASLPPGLQPITDKLTGLGWAPAWPSADALRQTARWMLGDDVTDPLTSTTLPHPPAAA